MLGGPDGLSTDNAVTIPRGTWSGAVFRQDIDGAGDLDDDGYDDVLIGAWGSQVHIWRGSADVLDVDPWLSLEQGAIDNFGYSVAGVGDMNGDGWPDIAACGIGSNDMVHLYPGSASGPGVAWEVPTEASCEGELRGLGDLNGDGFDDLIAGSSSSDHLLLGSAELGGEPLSLRPETHHYSYSDPVFGHSGDVDGDGWLDVASSRENDDTLTIYQGSQDGPGSGQAWYLSDDRLSGWYAQAVDMGGDMDGDGLSELIVGTGHSDDTNGGAYLYSGHTDGPGAGSVLLMQDDERSNLGAAVAFGGDLNGDGYDDLAIGAPSAGQVHLLYGGGDEDGDGWIWPRDCDDDQAAVHPDGVEICNGLDDDCDGATDGADAEGATTWYQDYDGDGFASPNVSEDACEPPESFIDGSEPWDCDDYDDGVHPEADEIEGDQIDQDCDGWDAGGPGEADSGEPGGEGCGCEAGSARGGWLLLAGIALVATRRRRELGLSALLGTLLLGCPGPGEVDSALEAMEGKPFRTLLGSADGTTWLGGQEDRCGAWSADNGYQEIPRPGDWHRGTGIRQFVEHDGVLWVWLDDQLMRWTGDGWDEATPLLGETADWGYEGQLQGITELAGGLWAISQLTSDTDPDCYFGCDETHDLYLHRWDGTGWVRVEHLKIEGSSGHVAAAGEALLLAQDEALWAWEEGTLEPIEHPLEDKIQQVVGTTDGTIVARDKTGAIAIGDRHGLVSLEGPLGGEISLVAAMAGDDVYGFSGGGLYHHDGSAWSEVPVDTDSVEALHVGQSGEIAVLGGEGSNSLHMGDLLGVVEVWREGG